jgi:hypothetical protein
MQFGISVVHKKLPAKKMMDNALVIFISGAFIGALFGRLITFTIMSFALIVILISKVL